MIIKETEIKHPLYVTTLENGILLCVYDGYAEGSDGKIYHCVERQTGGDEYEFLGWRCAGQNAGQKFEKP